MELEIPDTDRGGWTIVAASGEVDVAAAPVLRDRIAELIESGTTRLVIDLEGVDFIDSTGLGVLVGGVRRARSAGGDLRVVCTNPRILRVFEVTGLGSTLTVSTDIDDAVAAPAGD